jgi:hypothetical protein
MTMARRTIPALGVMLVLGLALTGCGGGDSPDAAARCEAEFEKAAEQPVNERRPSTLYDAAVACQDLSEWGRAADLYPSVLDGRTALEVATEICDGEEPRVYNSELCANL